MKVLSFIFLFFLMFSCLLCHVEPDQGGLFTKIVRSNAIGQDRQQVRYEPRQPSEQIEPQQNQQNDVTQNLSASAAESLVFNIQGMVQFTKLVVKNSYSKPVVLKLYSPMSQDTGKVTPVFQAIADEFKNQVIFAGLDVSQNMDIFLQISMFYRLKKVDLPLFLFYKDGQLLMPFLAGFQPKEYLSSYIQKKFFGGENVQSDDQDVKVSLNQ